MNLGDLIKKAGFYSEADSRYELLVKIIVAEAADEAHQERCKYPGDFIVEHFGVGNEIGAAAWRASMDPILSKNENE